MIKQSVECPLCSKTFLSSNIENHAQTCLEKKSLNPSPVANISKTSMKRRLESKQSVSDKKRTSPWSKMQPELEIADGKSSSLNLLSNSSNYCSNKLNETVSTKQSIFFKKPLAELARPSCLDEYVGQTNVVGSHTALFKLLHDNLIPSMIFWGPPGCGKTTLALIIANNVKKHNVSSKNKIHFVKLSATNSGKAELQETIKTAMNKQHLFCSKTIVFIDEVHRYSKLQQDTLLPALESGTITLIGATTENPSFVLNSALLSRCRVIVLEKLITSHVKSLLLHAVNTHLPEVILLTSNSSNDLVSNTDEDIFLYEESLDILASFCDGDARTALNGLQVAVQTMQHTVGKKIIDKNLIKECLQRTSVLYDRAGDQHYDITSALHKSIRGCDDNAALYWLTRMIVGGEDPRFIARRLIRIASEDIGLADPNALNQAVSCYHACLYVGMPECDVNLAQCVVYLARAPKSIEVYAGLKKAKDCIKENVGPSPAVPLHLRNAPTKLMKSLDYGKGYKYLPDEAIGQTYLPEELLDVKFLS